MKKLPYLVSLAAVWLSIAVASAQESPVDYVNPFIGTTNYGTTNPGAICPQGMMSVVPFNVMGGKSVGNKWRGMSGVGLSTVDAYNRKAERRLFTVRKCL